MRRADREMDVNFAYSIIDSSQYGVISTINEDATPYAVPVSTARDGKKIYLHGACGGSKIENIGRNPSVSMAFVGAVNVPEPINDDEFEKARGDKLKMGKLVSKKFTTEFESAVIFGTATIVSDDAEKIHGLRLLSEKYTPENMDYFDFAIEVSLERTCVIRIDIDNITGKRKKYDNKGVEMKWGV